MTEPLSADYFDGFYEGVLASPRHEGLWRSALQLPGGLDSTSLLSGPALDEVVGLLSVGPDDLLLDLGCGRAGYGLEVAQRTGTRMVGVDFSPVAIRQGVAAAGARGLAGRVELRVGDLAATGVDDASADAVMCIDAIQFSRSVPATLAEVRRVLRPGGRVVITTWEASSVAARSEIPSRLAAVDLARQLPEAGFESVSVAERPDWRATERHAWETVVAADPGGEPEMVRSQEEGRRALELWPLVRRVLGVATRSP